MSRDHPLMNTFSQMSLNDKVLLDYMAKVICNLFTIYIYIMYQRKKRTLDK